MARSYATQSIIFVLIQGVFLSGIINNLAHIGGITGGYAAARVLDPLEAGARRSHRHRARLSGRVSSRRHRVSNIGMPLYLRLLSLG